MGIERKTLEALFHKLGAKLNAPATLCIFGSAPAILMGQPSRQTQDVDVWHPKSNYDAGDLARACNEAGVLYDPTGEIDPNAVYLQIVRPGIVALPSDFDTEAIGRYGMLTVVMPVPVVLSAAKLARASDNDLGDIVWWVRHRSIAMQQLEHAVRQLPSQRQRETAEENLVLVRLVSGS